MTAVPLQIDLEKIEEIRREVNGRFVLARAEFLTARDELVEELKCVREVSAKPVESETGEDPPDEGGAIFRLMNEMTFSQEFAGNNWNQFWQNRSQQPRQQHGGRGTGGGGQRAGTDAGDLWDDPHHNIGGGIFSKGNIRNSRSSREQPVFSQDVERELLDGFSTGYQTDPSYPSQSPDVTENRGGKEILSYLARRNQGTAPAQATVTQTWSNYKNSGNDQEALMNLKSGQTAATQHSEIKAILQSLPKFTGKTLKDEDISNLLMNDPELQQHVQRAIMRRREEQPVVVPQQQQQQQQQDVRSTSVVEQQRQMTLLAEIKTKVAHLDEHWRTIVQQFEATFHQANQITDEAERESHLKYVQVQYHQYYQQWHHQRQMLLQQAQMIQTGLQFDHVTAQQHAAAQYQQQMAWQQQQAGPFQGQD